MEQPLLEISRLTVSYQVNNTWLDAVNQVSLTIPSGKILGLVGESGSGKTTLAMAVMGYLGVNGRVREGSIRLEGRDLLGLSQAEMREVWGKQIALVPQDPVSSLNPSLTIGEQIRESLQYRAGLDRRTAREVAFELLEKVRLPDPARVASAYPHQVSGGMQQRVLIAMAISLSPRLLIMDEPTTGLDVTTQASILDLLNEIVWNTGASALYVTHNLGVVAQLCNEVAVLYAGELVETAPVAELLSLPLHPYTLGLLESTPFLGQRKDIHKIEGIPGRIPPLGARGQGCIFVDRCPFAIPVCAERPPLYQAASNRRTRCHRWEELAAGLQWDSPAPQAKKANPDLVPAAIQSAPGIKMLELEDVQVRFKTRRSLDDLFASRPPQKIHAVDGVSFSIPHGTTLGLVGESGSGKSTLARAVAGLVKRDSGDIRFHGLSLPGSLSQRSRDILRSLQMVFQNPDESLNPHLRVGEIISRPLMVLLKMDGESAAREAARLLQAVGLPPEYTKRPPSQLSGGEKQRVAIARAFATQPDLLLADEPVSALDQSVQATILNLLQTLQVEQGTTLLMISHDLSVVSFLADTVAVMYLGRLMEMTGADNLLTAPHHPYTEALLSAIPTIGQGPKPERIRLEGTMPEPAGWISGCPFHTRCPRYLGAICADQTPPWQVVEASGKRYYCHIPPEELRAMQQPAPAEGGKQQ
jgi:peptide/nickel transport system ATP-binding protein